MRAVAIIIITVITKINGNVRGKAFLGNVGIDEVTMQKSMPIRNAWIL